MPDTKMRRIGFVAGAGGFEKMAVTNKAFFDALEEAGYLHGKTMQVVFRTAEGDMSKMPALVQDVLSERVEILVVSTSPGCAAAKAAIKSIPVLCISVQDHPIKAGLTTRLSHPDSNVIGVYSYLPDGISQQLTWLGRFVPQLKTVAVLYNPQNPTHTSLLEEWKRVAAENKVRVVPLPVVRVVDLDDAFLKARQENAQIGIGLLGADTYAIRKEIAEKAKSSGFPMAMDTPGGYTDIGGVATVGVDIVPYYRRGATELMLPLLSGRQVADLSWIGPKQVDVRLNEPVARSFGLLVPPVQTKN
jgi:ABC-type uncharacterized transport system substrate-binding protein